MFRTVRSKETSQTAVVQDPSEVDGDNLENGRCEELIQAGGETVYSGIHELINSI
jgi:hypothetical protein